MADKIIIFSGKQYSGKDSAGRIMLESMPEYHRCAMGDIIKIEYGKKYNLTYEEIENNKSQHRAGLIKLGNWGRSQSPDYWINKIINSEGNIIVTDVRVPHEYEVFKKAGAVSIRIEADRNIRSQRGVLVGENDITEVGLDDITCWDYVITNNEDFDTFKEKVLEIVKILKGVCGKSQN
ncbi:MAG: hypothetical protein LUB59_04925 [Candidatus Gastranaerophilales bacterium]|nr:hypothetical protein [Candidatus Gastranaerophilales bacterium]